VCPQAPVPQGFRGSNPLPRTIEIVVEFSFEVRDVGALAKKDESYSFFLRSLGRLMIRYEGQYVAIVGKSIVAHGKDAKKVYEIAHNKFPKKRVLIGQVPLKEALVLWTETMRPARALQVAVQPSAGTPEPLP